MRLNIPTLTALITDSLPLKEWGFLESAKTDLTIIYNSQWCRIKFLIEEDRSKDYLHIYYGRLHALDNEWTMMWNAENCYCWHMHSDLRLALRYLDSLSAQEAYKAEWTELQLFQDYFNSESAKSISNNDERFLKLHSVIWAHYGIRLFELFDLRHPDLWEQYIDFLKEYYRLHDEVRAAVDKCEGIISKPVDPPYYKKC